MSTALDIVTTYVNGLTNGKYGLEDLNYDDRLRVVSDEIVGSTHWLVTRDIVFSASPSYGTMDVLFFKVTVEEAPTEDQNVILAAHQVHPEQKLITVYV